MSMGVECNMIYIEMKKKSIVYYLKLTFIRNSLQKIVGVLRVILEGFGVQMTPRCPAGSN